MPAVRVFKHRVHPMRTRSMTLAARRQQANALHGNHNNDNNQMPQPRINGPVAITTTTTTATTTTISTQATTATTTITTRVLSPHPSRIIKSKPRNTPRFRLNVTDRSWVQEVAHRRRQMQAQTQNRANPTAGNSLPGDFFQDSVTNRIKRIILVINKSEQTIRPKYVFDLLEEAAAAAGRFQIKEGTSFRVVEESHVRVQMEESSDFRWG